MNTRYQKETMRSNKNTNFQDQPIATYINHKTNDNNSHDKKILSDAF